MVCIIPVGEEDVFAALTNDDDDDVAVVVVVVVVAVGWAQDEERFRINAVVFDDVDDKLPGFFIRFRRCTLFVLL